MTGTAAAVYMGGFDFGTTWALTDSSPRPQWGLGALALTLADATIDVGESTQATVTLSSVDTTTETETIVSEYESDDETVATVDADSLVEDGDTSRRCIL